MHIAPPDRSLGESEWRPFVEAQGWGHLVAPGADLTYPVVVPTQFVLEGDQVITHFAAANPVLDALRANPPALMSVAGDWAFIPSAWKAIREEDPALGIPTTYYAAVQLLGTAEVIDDLERIDDVLGHQLRTIQPEVPIASPIEAHRTQLRTIRGVLLTVTEVRAKFKYGGNVDADHRTAVIDLLHTRNGPGDPAAAAHTRRRLDAGA